MTSINRRREQKDLAKPNQNHTARCAKEKRLLTFNAYSLNALHAKSIQHHHWYRAPYAPVFTFLWVKKRTMEGKPLFRIHQAAMQQTRSKPFWRMGIPKGKEVFFGVWKNISFPFG